ncbi:tetratricopeptide repeat protein [Thioflexithrix psekupsensis]|uniref:tetratricopeptide repeat protein n=1 Tax=Thioflexithrix psekupsensis TaxID=1570016 RepID=UPI000A3BFC8D|nr:tetratricopeptide repeat protein [Thioflexithrix psekupsensis]
MRFFIIGINLLLLLSLQLAFAQTAAPDSRAAVITLLNEAKAAYEQGQNEQAAAALERALRIDPRNPALWHNLAGVRLQQEDWMRAANLAAKSNSLASDNKWLRVRNWVLIALACEAMSNMECTMEARSRARALAN